LNIIIWVICASSANYMFSADVEKGKILILIPPI